MSRALAALSLMLIWLNSLTAAEFHVPDEIDTIQAAIDESQDGDIIIVGPGRYKECLDFLGKSITVKSEQGPTATIVDAMMASSVVIFRGGDDPGSVLQGFTLTNGTGSQEPLGFKSGGGIYCESSSPMIVDNIITGNVISRGYGGGIFCCGKSAPNISRNIICGNDASGCGGGIYARQSLPDIENNMIYNNRSGETGGGMAFSLGSRPDIINNTVYGNLSPKGGGISCAMSARLVIVNTIIWGNHATKKGDAIWAGIASEPSLVYVAYCDVEGGSAAVHMESGCVLSWGAGIIDADPLFVEPEIRDYHLTWESPCRDAGNNKVISSTFSFDFENDPRATAEGAMIDIGADEFHLHLYITGKLTPGQVVKLNIIGTPNMDPIRLIQSARIQNPPWKTEFGDLYVRRPFLADWNLGPIPTDGLRVIESEIPDDIQPDSRIILQALVGGLKPDARLTNPLFIQIK